MMSRLQTDHHVRVRGPGAKRVAARACCSGRAGRVTGNAFARPAAPVGRSGQARVCAALAGDLKPMSVPAHVLDPGASNGASALPLQGGHTMPARGASRLGEREHWAGVCPCLEITHRLEPPRWRAPGQSTAGPAVVRHLPFLLSSGFAGPNRAEAGRVGVHILTKPYTLHELQGALARTRPGTPPEAADPQGQARA